MPWTSDPYEWIDPEVGRTASVWANPPKTAARRPGGPTDQTALRLSARDCLVSYVGRHGLEATREVMVRVTGKGRLTQVPDGKLVDLIEALK